MNAIRLAMLAAVLGSSAVQATTYRFAYAADAGLVTGRLTGTLQGDGNTILVSSVEDYVRLGGVALPAFPVVTTGSALYDVPRAPTATLDGTNLDFLACTAGDYCPEAIGFDPDTLAFTPVFRIFIGSISPDLIEEAADASRWSISAVPEPAAWGLMIAGFVLVGISARRRPRAVAA